jgi:sec-independent protein translocase protein TatC
MEVGQPMITIKDYVSLLLLLIAGFGIVFETPVLIVLLAMLDIVTVETLTKYRRLVVVLILIVAAVLTPPDPISQVALAVPVYIMYELAIIVIRVIKKRQAPT